MCGIPDMTVTECCSIWRLCSRAYIPGCEVSELFECVSQVMMSLWSVWVFVSQDERFLIWLWVYIPGCEFSDLFGCICPGHEVFALLWVYVQWYKVSDLLEGIYLRVWDLWSVCHCMSQDVRSLFLGVCQMYKVSDLFLGFMPLDVRALISLWVYVPVCELSDLFVVYVPRYEVSELFVDIFPWLLYFWAFLVVVFWGYKYSDLLVKCVLQDMRTILSEGVCPRVWGLCCVCGCGCEVSKVFVGIVPRM